MRPSRTAFTAWLVVTLVASACTGEKSRDEVQRSDALGDLPAEAHADVHADLDVQTKDADAFHDAEEANPPETSVEPLPDAAEPVPDVSEHDASEPAEVEVKTDVGSEVTPAACDPVCLGDSDWSSCVPQDGTLSWPSCVGCNIDRDCWFNPGALGPRCIDNECGCNDSSDCSGFPTGSVCLPGLGFPISAGVCVCTSDEDCPTDWRPVCTIGDLAEWGASRRHCTSPCLSNTDCTEPHASYPICDVPTGRCVECISDGDCVDGLICDAETSLCSECSEDADCAHSFTGHSCTLFGAITPVPEAGECNCVTDTDCKGPFSTGGLCANDSDYPGCACSKDTDCAESARGPVCQHFDGDSGFFYGMPPMCGCRTDEDCTVEPYTRCNLAFWGDPDVSYPLVCQEPCTSDDQCPGWWAGCESVSGDCVQCFVDEDCVALTQWMPYIGVFCDTLDWTCTYTPQP